MIRPLRRVFRPLAPLGSLLKEAYDSAWAHNIGRMAASIAYFGAFSLAPMIVIMTTLASQVFGKSATQGLIAERLTSTFGADTAKFIQSTAGRHLWQHAVSPWRRCSPSSCWCGRPPASVGSVRGALNDIWGVTGARRRRTSGLPRGQAHRRRHGDRHRLHVPRLDARQRGGHGPHQVLLASMLPVPGWMLQVFGVLFSLAVTIAFLAVIFRVLPNIKVRFMHILVGASITGSAVQHRQLRDRPVSGQHEPRDRHSEPPVLWPCS